jgi:formylmethanofuran dehydrogenase subunit A
MAVSVKGDGAEEASAVERAAALLARDGELVVRDGEVVNFTWGQVFQVAPSFDTAIERRLARFYDRYYDVELSSFGVPGYIAARPDRLATVPCLH